MFGDVEAVTRARTSWTQSPRLPLGILIQLPFPQLQAGAIAADWYGARGHQKWKVGGIEKDLRKKANEREGRCLSWRIWPGE